MGKSIDIASSNVANLQHYIIKIKFELICSYPHYDK